MLYVRFIVANGPEATFHLHLYGVNLSALTPISARQDEKASSDAGAMAIGMILFWPALFLLDGDEESASEVARLKGEMDAIEQANIQKNCGIQFG
jgi:hypothetical protein